MYRFVHRIVVYNAELDFIYPRHHDWTGLDCTDALDVLGLKILRIDCIYW